MLEQATYSDVQVLIVNQASLYYLAGARRWPSASG